MELKGNVALVTGSGLEEGRPGIGFGCAEALARTGMKIMLCDVSIPRLENAKRTIESMGVECATHSADVFDLNAAKSTVDATIGVFGGIGRAR
ncbi:MAG TPA: SDR family oxidoreductase [Candidatus Paceibacterota bacterium]|nr:SDR family oxidoreductase [Candidatus Paceibacterota bacterium]